MKIAITAGNRFALVDEERIIAAKLIRDGRRIKVGGVEYPLYRGFDYKSNESLKRIMRQQGY